MAQVLPSIRYTATTRLAAKKVERIKQGRLKSEPLHTAAEQGHCGEMLDLLGPGTDINLRDGRLNSPLHLAADEGHIDCVAALIDAKADLVAQRIDTATPLHLAAANGHTDVLAMLIAEAVAQKAAVAEQNDALTCEQERLVKGRKEIGDERKILLAEAKLKELTAVAAGRLAECADFNCQTKRGCTALHRAAKNGHTDCVKMIDAAYRQDAAWVFDTFDKDGSGTIDAEELADINDSCRLGLDEAAMAEALGESGELPFSDLVAPKLQRAHSRMDVHTPFGVGAAPVSPTSVMTGPLRGTTPVMWRGENPPPLAEEFEEDALPPVGKSFMRYWVALKTTLPDMYQSTALHEAASCGNVECCIQLLKMYADPHLENMRGQTPRDCAIARNHHRLAGLLEEAMKPDAEKEVISGSTKWHKRWYQLQLCRRLKKAATNNDVEVVSSILKFGVNPQEYLNSKRNTDEAQAVVDAADLQYRRDNERGPLHQAECELVMAQDDFEKQQEARTAEVEEAMGWIDEIDRDRNALLAAGMHGRFDIIKLLIEFKAQIDVKDKTGRSPLLLAAMNGHWACLDMLIESGMDLHATDGFGWTPLHLSSKHGHAKCVAKLIEAKADLGAFDGYGCSPIVWAMKSGHQDCLSLLQKAGADELAMTTGSSSQIFVSKAKVFSKSRIHDEANSSNQDAASNTFNTIAFSRAGETHIDQGLRLMMRARGGMQELGTTDAAPQKKFEGAWKDRPVSPWFRGPGQTAELSNY